MKERNQMQQKKSIHISHPALSKPIWKRIDWNQYQELRKLIQINFMIQVDTKVIVWWSALLTHKRKKKLKSLKLSRNCKQKEKIVSRLVFLFFLCNIGGEFSFNYRDVWMKTNLATVVVNLDSGRLIKGNRAFMKYD